MRLRLQEIAVELPVENRLIVEGSDKRYGPGSFMVCGVVAQVDSGRVTQWEWHGWRIKRDGERSQLVMKFSSDDKRLSQVKITVRRAAGAADTKLWNGCGK